MLPSMCVNDGEGWVGDELRDGCEARRIGSEQPLLRARLRPLLACSVSLVRLGGAQAREQREYRGTCEE